MPYSITTRDGITIDGIPDEMPADHPELKARVAAIRGQKPQAPATPKPAAPSNGFAMGLRDPIDAGAQMLEQVLPDSLATGLNKSTNWLRENVPGGKYIFAQVDETPTGTTKLVKDINAEYDRKRREGAQSITGLVTGQQQEPGFDWGRLAGNVINPVNLVGGAGLRGATTVRQLATQGAKAVPWLVRCNPYSTTKTGSGRRRCSRPQPVPLVVPCSLRLPQRPLNLVRVASKP